MNVTHEQQPVRSPASPAAAKALRSVPLATAVPGDDAHADREADDAAAAAASAAAAVPVPISAGGLQLSAAAASAPLPGVVPE